MLEKQERLNKVVRVIARIIAIMHWVGAGLLLACLVIGCIAADKLQDWMAAENGLTISGDLAALLGEGGELALGAFIPVLLGGAVMCGLSAMIFRSVYLIFKTTAGETKASQGKTPFQPDNVRRLRQIGFFSIAVSVVECLSGVAERLIDKAGAIEIEISLTGVFFGVLMLCLAQFFAYGVQLQSDTDGLL